MANSDASSLETVCWPENGQWHVAPLAGGPFPGQHGGVVCSQLAKAAEQRAGELDAGAGLQLTAYIPRVAALGPSSLTTEDIRVGSRAAVIKAEMTQGDKLVGWASAVFVKPQPVEGAGDWPHAPQTPATAPFDIGRRLDKEWFRDTVDMRQDGNGMVWLRHKVATVPDMGPLAFTASLADWTSGFTRPSWVDRAPVAAFPNVDLTIHLLRAPRGDWVGIDGHSIWHHGGHGSTFAALHDQDGLFGRSAQTVVLVNR